ncbi:MAG: Holliday junction resolvase RuvX [Patescibacteria group bacterium]|nr:Holliday junction resolvase RuvX [Patescibacteria group bacterium]MDE2116574.1 Holliday junction resolvase RuvX [Patescibacteria group bacterium]
MRLLGIDYGKKKVGLALSDDKGLLAFPKAVLPNDKFLVSEIADLVRGHGVETIVMGESRDYEMNLNPIMSRIKPFADELERATGIVVVYEPEILTSHQAAHFQGKTDMIDASAASIILQSYIDRHTNESGD